MYHNVFHENNLPDIPSLHEIGITISSMNIMYSRFGDSENRGNKYIYHAMKECQVDFFMADIMIPISCNEGM
jgi:hypothetical protein